jgi:hypothetical protein
VEIGIETLVEWFEDATDASMDARESSERARDYYDGYQLTSEQTAELSRRKQPAVVFNRIQPKIDFLLGTERKQRTDPKAFPRTPDHDEAADAATDGIRYVEDNNNFDVISSDAFENMLIEGTGGVAVEVDKETLEITLKRVAWDRYFYDPHSREKDHSDIMYDGIVMWMDFSEAKVRWGEKAKELETQMAHVLSMGDTYEDKPTNRRWFDGSRNRVMVVQINFKSDGKWMTAIYTQNVVLEDIKESPYVDEFGKPLNPLIMASVKVDREGNRYGAVRGLIDIQDEINKRRSKALHILNTRQTFSKEGHLKDINKFKREANKPDGHLEYPPQGEFGRDFGIVPDTGLVASQFAMYQDSIQQMDSVSANAAMSGTTDAALSGRAVQALQQGGNIELGPLFDVHQQWKKRVAIAIWARIKQFWKEEKWIRVTDDEENLKWVGLNQPITMAEQAVMTETGGSLTQVKEQFGDQIQAFSEQNPEMLQPVATNNEVAEIDVDIIIEEVPDTVNLQGEQFDMLVKMYQANPNGIPWESVVEMSTLRNKDKVLGKDDPEQAQAQQQLVQQQQAESQLDMGETQSVIDKNNATTEKTRQESIQKQIENALILANPGATNVSI